MGGNCSRHSSIPTLHKNIPVMCCDIQWGMCPIQGGLDRIIKGKPDKTMPDKLIDSPSNVNLCLCEKIWKYSMRSKFASRCFFIIQVVQVVYRDLYVLVWFEETSPSRVNFSSKLFDTEFCLQIRDAVEGKERQFCIECNSSSKHEIPSDREEVCHDFAAVILLICIGSLQA